MSVPHAALRLGYGAHLPAFQTATAPDVGAMQTAVLTDDGKLALPPDLRANAQLRPGDSLDVPFYKGTIVLRTRQPLTPEKCAALLERSRSQPKPTAEDDRAVEDAIKEVRARRMTSDIHARA